MRPRNGFTLLEASVSLAVLSLVGLAALGAVQQDLDFARRARGGIEATALLEDRLEAVRLLESNDLELLPDSLVRGTFAPPFEAFRWTVHVDPVAHTPGLYDVVVEVTRDEKRRQITARLYRPSKAEGVSLDRSVAP